jgi:hypothetical protein
MASFFDHSFRRPVFASVPAIWVWRAFTAEWCLVQGEFPLSCFGSVFIARTESQPQALARITHGEDSMKKEQTRRKTPAAFCSEGARLLFEGVGAQWR